MCMIRRISVSFCLGSDSASSSVSAARPVSLMTASPRVLNKRPLRCRKSANKNAPLRLLPSENGWFLTTKYRRCAALLSMLGAVCVWFVKRILRQTAADARRKCEPMPSIGEYFQRSRYRFMAEKPSQHQMQAAPQDRRVRQIRFALSCPTRLQGRRRVRGRTVRWLRRA